MKLAQQLYDAGLRVFPCLDNKKPAVKRNDSWKDYATRPPSQNYWPSALVGVPIPDRCVVLDLDTYKGATREQVDAALGVTLPWDRALIQTTMHGGQHYAFKCDWRVKFGSNITDVKGFDTRTPGKGYIATGAPYYTPHGFGLFALAHPGALPELPDACRPILEHITAPPRQTAPMAFERDTQTVLSALRHVDPGCDRTLWVKIGLSLRSYYQENEDEGFAVFDQWSSGELWPDGTPSNYNPDDMVTQWSSFKPEGATGAASLFYEAIQRGWAPPSTLDTSKAFGADAAPLEVFNEMHTQIVELGGDSRNVDTLLDAIAQSGCNGIQSLLLRNELKALLREAKLLDKDLTAAIDQRLPSAAGLQIAGVYGKNHTLNATTFLDVHYPDGTLFRVNENWYSYDGQVWVEREDAAIQHEVCMAMLTSQPQNSTIAGTYSILAQLAYRQDIVMDRFDTQVVLFNNGILDLTTGALLPHDKRYYTTRILPYNFNPTARADRWVTFLNEVLDGDQECIVLLQQWMGYMLSPTYQYQKVLLMLGPRRSGKSLIGRIVNLLVGEANYTGASLSSFAEDDFLDSLRGKTVAFSGDTPKHVNRNKIDSVVERIKNISGGDAVEFGRKYKSRMNCRLPTRIMMSANHVPQLFDDSGALAGRILVLPFEVSFADREDPYLPEVLAGEIEGICLWALQGLASLNQNGRFSVPQASLSESQFIAESYSPLKVFSDACCVFGNRDDVVSVAELYDAYKAWAVIDQQPNIMGRNTFISAFKDATRGMGPRYGVHRTDTDVWRGFQGVRLVHPGPTTASAFTPKLVQ